ncbi:DUF4412 domain-containing protein [Winogradskyella helgolandensis]|uniref:DUF4412 domain-containing protein n=1 Tax=Winogradskyella helgolandensis TaxID=2697010 RepID=UPI0015BB21AA|nr:DUF4412 domain-containing protein [Winogradskyella helgolandensis]
MKALKPLFLTLVFLLMSNAVQAQFWKKLAKKAEKKIEREAGNRAEKRVNKNIDKVFDEAEDGIDNIDLKTEKVDVKLPDSYHFEWKYSMKTETQDKEINMYYMLKKEAAYIGIIVILDEFDTSKNSKTIMDGERGAFITFMDVNGQKIYRAMELPEADPLEENTNNFTLEKTDTKEILGYSCQGYRTQINEGTMHFYMANNAPISLHSAFGKNQNMPKGFNKELLTDLKDGLMLEAEFTSDKNSNNNFKTTCTELKKVDYTLDVSQYGSLSELGSKN